MKFCLNNSVHEYFGFQELLQKFPNFLARTGNKGTWEFYDKLNNYRKKPDEKLKVELEKEFDELFSIKTEYSELDKRITLTCVKKKELLLVLTFPEIPLHNNPAELALREIVIKRKISNGTRSEDGKLDGKLAWENMMSIMDTCRKLGSNFFNYILDIFSEKCSMTKLATLIYKVHS